MAAAGTLLSDLDGSGGGGGDGDLVQKILSDLNIPSSSSDSGAFRGANIPPAMPAQTPQSYNQMNSGSVQPMTMDSRIPTSHMIGSDHPTPADFAAAMTGARVDSSAMYAPASSNNMMSPMNPTNSLNSMQHMPGAMAYDPPSKNIYGTVLSEIKVPAVVAILFFIFSLPPVRVLVAHYLPSLIKATGEFHITGLLTISVIVAITFWILQRIIAPLLSL